MRLLNKLLGKPRKNMQFTFLFEEPIPYEENRHAIVSIPMKFQTMTDWCKNFSFLRLLSKDNKQMLGLQVHLYDVHPFNEDKVKESAAFFLALFKQAGIQAKLDNENSEELPEGDYNKFTESYKSK